MSEQVLLSLAWVFMFTCLCVSNRSQIKCYWYRTWSKEEGSESDSGSRFLTWILDQFVWYTHHLKSCGLVWMKCGMWPWMDSCLLSGSGLFHSILSLLLCVYLHWLWNPYKLIFLVILLQRKDVKYSRHTLTCFLCCQIKVEACVLPVRHLPNHTTEYLDFMLLMMAELVWSWRRWVYRGVTLLNFFHFMTYF